MISSDTFTVQESSKVSRLGGANVRFYGEELCVAVTKVTEVEKQDGTTDRSSACLKSCFGVGGGTRLDTYSGTFGRITSNNPPCCLSGKTTTLRFQFPHPQPRLRLLISALHVPAVRILMPSVPQRLAIPVISALRWNCRNRKMARSSP